jgi:hypothetical protein
MAKIIIGNQWRRKLRGPQAISKAAINNVEWRNGYSKNESIINLYQ